jgi:hypothetical protein
MPRDRNAVVRHGFVAFNDQVGFDVVFGTCDLVALASDEPAVEGHCGRGADDFASVVGGVTEADEIDHGWFSGLVGCAGLGERFDVLRQSKLGSIYLDGY